MGKKRGKTTVKVKPRPRKKPVVVRRQKKKPKQKPKSQTKKKRTKRVVRKTQRKRNNPAPVRVRRGKNQTPTPKKRAQTPPKSKPTRKGKTVPQRLTGNSTRIPVDSRVVGKGVTIIRKTTKLSGGTKVARGKRGPKLLAQTFEGSAINHFHNIGPSHKNYYYVRIQYSFTVKGKKVISHFSTGIAKIRNENQFREYLADILESFTDSLVGYAKGGFQNIRVSGIIVQGYEK